MFAPLARPLIVAVVTLGAGIAVSTTTVAAAAPAAAPATSNDVYVIQGVPGDDVDVEIDGKSVGESLAAKEVLGPLDLATGKHSISLTSADWNVDSSFDVSNKSLDVVVHWPADKSRTPEVTIFGNDMSPVAADKGRVTIAHTAVVPPADVRVDEEVLFANIANGEFVSADVPAITYSVDIVPTGTSANPLLGPVDLAVTPGALTRVFAIGQPKNGSMDVVVQTLDLGNAGSPAPHGVDAGSAGLVATADARQSTQASGTPLVLAGVVVALCAGAALVRRRARW